MFDCPGASPRNCEDCEYGHGGSGNGACGNAWHCDGDCCGCEDVDCDNNPENPDYGSEG